MTKQAFDFFDSKPVHPTCISGLGDTSCTNRTMKRRHRVLATAVVLASVAGTCSGFSSNSACFSAQHHSSNASHDDGIGCFERQTGASSPLLPRSPSLVVLNMVSYLEAPTTVSTGKERRGSSRGGEVKYVPQKAARDRIQRQHRQPQPIPNKPRTIEIDLPSFDAFEFDIVTSSGKLKLQSEHAPRTWSSMDQIHGSKTLSSSGASSGSLKIDSEILYEGFRSPLFAEQPEHPISNATLPNEVENVTAPAVLTLATITQSSAAKSSTTNLQRKTGSHKSKRKSSTMPGFIRNTDLDSHVTTRGMRMVPARGKFSRILNSKAAKMKRRRRNSEALYKNSASVPDSFADYTNEIHSISRVTPKEEVELGTKTQEAMRLQRMFDDLLNQYGREPTDDEWCAAAGKINMEALSQALNDGIEAKNQLVASNLRMVQRVVNLYIRNGLGSEYNAGDLMQDGTMALIRAAEKYEPDRGFRFSTYAMYWIRSAVKRSQTTQSRIVNIPQRIHETHKRVTKTEEQLRKELGREPTKKELATACEITVLQLERCRRAMRQASYSLDAEVQNTYKPNSSSTRKNTMYDIVASKVDEMEYEKTQRALMKEHLISTLRRYLSPHEVDLLLLRYGLMDERALPQGMSGPLTIAEVSKLVGLKPDKVRRIIINSQKQLRHLMKEWEDVECELA